MQSRVSGLVKHPFTYVFICGSVFVAWSQLQPPNEGSSLTFLDRLQIVGSNPFTFLAFTFLICGRFYYVFAVKQIEVVLDAIKDLPDNQQLEKIRVASRQDLSQIPPEHRLEALVRRQRLVFGLATLASILILTAIIAHAWKIPDAEVIKSIGKTTDKLQRWLEVEADLSQKATEKETAKRQVTEQQLQAAFDFILSPTRRITDREKELGRLIDEDNSPYAQALKAITEGRMEDARKLLEIERERLLQRNIKATGDTYYLERDYEEALHWYYRAWKLSDDDPEAKQNVAICYFNLGFLSHSIRAFDELVDQCRKRAQNSKDIHISDDLARAINDRSIVLDALDRVDECRRDQDEAIQLFTELTATGRRPDLLVELSISRNGRGAGFLDRLQLGAAIEDFNECVQILEGLLKRETMDVRRDLALVLDNRGMAQRLNKNLLAARDDHTASMKLFDEVAHEFADRTKARAAVRHDYANALMHRATTHRLLDEHKPSLADYSEALLIFEPNEGEASPSVANKIAECLNGQGTARREMGEVAPSIASYERAICIRDRLIKDGYTNLEREQALVLSNLAVAFRAANRFPEADTKYAESERILRYLIDQRGVNELQDELALTLSNHGNLLRLMGRFEKARDLLLDAAQRFQDVAQTAEGDNLANNMGKCFNNLGIVEMQLAIQAEDETLLGSAADNLGKAIKIRDELVNAGQSHVRSELGGTLVNRGGLHLKFGDPEKALADISRAVGIYEQLVESEGKRHFAGDFARALTMRGQLWVIQEKLDAARSDLEKARSHTMDPEVLALISELFAKISDQPIPDREVTPHCEIHAVIHDRTYHCNDHFVSLT